MMLSWCFCVLFEHWKSEVCNNTRNKWWQNDNLWVIYPFKSLRQYQRNQNTVKKDACYRLVVLILLNPTCSLLNNGRISRDHHSYPASRVQISVSPLQWLQRHRQTKIHDRNSKLGNDTHLKTLQIHYVSMQSRGSLQGHLQKETSLVSLHTHRPRLNRAALFSQATLLTNGIK